MTKLRKQVVLTIFTNAVIFVTGMGASIILTRILLPEGRGEIAAAMIWPTLIATFGSLGLGDAIVYYGAQRTDAVGVVLFNALIIALVQSVVLIPIGYVIIPLVLASQSASVIELSRAYLVVIPLTLISQYATSINQSQMNNLRLNFIRLIVPTSYLGVVLSATLAGTLGVSTVIGGLVLANGVTLVTALGLLIGSKAYTQWHLDFSLMYDMVTYGTKFLINIVFSSANQRFDQVLLAAWASSGELGLYVIAVNSSSLVMLLPLAFQFILPAAIARQDDEQTQLRFIEQLLAPIWILCVISTIGMIILVPFLIPLLYGSEASGAILTTEILLVATLMLCGRTILSSVSLGLGVPMIASNAEVFSSILTVVFLLLLLKPLGIFGAGITSLISYTGALILMTHTLQRRFNLNLIQLLRPRVIIQTTVLETMRLTNTVKNYMNHLIKG